MKKAKNLYLLAFGVVVLCLPFSVWGEGVEYPYLREIQITETGQFLNLVVQIKDVAIWINKKGEIKKLETVSYRDAQERALKMERDYIRTPEPYGTYCEFFQGRLSKVDYHRVQYELFPTGKTRSRALPNPSAKKEPPRKIYGRRVREIGSMTFSYRENVLERIHFQELEWNSESGRLENFGDMRLLYHLGTGLFHQIWNSTEEQENVDVRIVYGL